MGDFMEPSITEGPRPRSLLTPSQTGVQDALGAILQQFLTGGGEGSFSNLLKGIFSNERQSDRLLKSAVKPINTEGLFESILNPSLRAFDDQIAPRLASGFARHGASFSTARGKETGRVLEGLHSSAQDKFTGVMAKLADSRKQRMLTASGVPLQQMMSQISAFGGMFGPAQNFLTPVSGFPDFVAEASPFSQTMEIVGEMAANPPFSK